VLASSAVAASVVNLLFFIFSPLKLYESHPAHN
jgi:hypothetical protein